MGKKHVYELKHSTEYGDQIQAQKEQHFPINIYVNCLNMKA